MAKKYYSRLAKFITLKHGNTFKITKKTYQKFRTKTITLAQIDHEVKLSLSMLSSLKDDYSFIVEICSMFGLRL